MRLLFTAWVWMVFTVIGLACVTTAFLLWIVTTPFDRQRRVNHLFSCFWAHLFLIAFPGWRIRVTGRHHIAWGRAYVLAANHNSIADIAVAFLLYRQFKWVSKASMFKAPILGWNMRMCRYVPLVRGEASSIARMMETCRSWLERGISILMFPEGSRSKDGQLKPFRHGAFTLAKEAGVDVVPIVIHGTRDVIPKHGLRFNVHAEIHVEVLPAISSAGHESAQSLSDAVRQRMLSALGARQGGEAPRRQDASSSDCRPGGGPLAGGPKQSESEHGIDVLSHST